ncbi:putative quinol monooxygenase [Lutibacter citreus]|uniref:putative quinol monooxygenase n=1 Tax=Lutibacter citreus TaxID=2138210 RepID=UPI000DBE04F5|nr:antibiotic biosynthesis monooxygenase [Lutibacter citreus]
MINLIIKFTVKPKHTEEFKNVLLENKKGAEQEEGFRGMNLFVDNKNPNVFFAYDSWKDEAALESHKNTIHVQNMMKLAETALESAPEILSLGATNPSPVAVKPLNAEDKPFVIFFIFKIKEEYRERLLNRFEIHIKNTRKEPGNLLFDLYTVNGVNDTLVVYEHWRTASDVWEIHMKQPYAKITGALMNEAVIGDLEPYMSFVTEIK